MDYMSNLKETINIAGVKKTDRAEFYQTLRDRVQIVDDSQFAQFFPPDQQGAFALFEGKLLHTQQGKELVDSSIVVNKDDFHIGDEDYSDLIPIVVEHEITELWLHSKPGYSLNPPPTNMDPQWVHMYGHVLATRREWEFAVEEGKGERYLEFLKRYAKDRQMPYEVEFIHECEYSLDRAKKAFQRKIRK